MLAAGSLAIYAVAVKLDSEYADMIGNISC